jgi:hypothetical protein
MGRADGGVRGRVWLRFAHEMNTATYPWSEEEGRNPSGSYVAVWRHLHAIFDAGNADNVTWLWSPDTPDSGTTPLEPVPGGRPGRGWSPNAEYRRTPRRP